MSCCERQLQVLAPLARYLAHRRSCHLASELSWKVKSTCVQNSHMTVFTHVLATLKHKTHPDFRLNFLAWYTYQCRRRTPTLLLNFGSKRCVLYTGECGILPDDRRSARSTFTDSGKRQLDTMGTTRTKAAAQASFPCL